MINYYFKIMGNLNETLIYTTFQKQKITTRVSRNIRGFQKKIKIKIQARPCGASRLNTAGCVPTALINLDFSVTSSNTQQEIKWLYCPHKKNHPGTLDLSKSKDGAAHTPITNSTLELLSPTADAAARPYIRNTCQYRGRITRAAF